MDSTSIRDAFIRHFEAKGHQRLPSAPLVLKDDPSVFFTSAGMQPLVPYFLGRKQPPAKRLVTIQKVFRTSDIEVVGTDSWHQTFWEMLGNFGIGDYWKKEAIKWGWELLVDKFHFDPNTLVATIYFDDDEAFDIWTKELALLPPERIYRLGNIAVGDETNFWSPGPTGLCGPCSEVFVDRGPQPGVPPHDCSPAENCGRYIEIWNFVFQQYDRREDGTLHDLPKRNIDTGVGLERLAQVLQGVIPDTFKTDLFKPLVQRIESLSGRGYGQDPANDRSIRIVAEHTRAAAFLIADGIAPSNEWRGYVLRRLIRRGALHARRLGLRPGAMAQISGDVVKSMQKHYHELTRGRERILETIQSEEEKFERTLTSGLEQLNSAVEVARSSGAQRIAGDTAFRLYDTYGFPMEMTREIASGAGLPVDEAGFTTLLDAQRARSRATAKFSQDAMRFGQFYAELKEREGVESQFIGYEALLAEDAAIRALAIAGRPVSEATEGTEVEVVLDRTPFYPEGGGQVGDSGDITTPDGRAMVVDTQAAAPAVIVMMAKVVDGTLRVGARATARVDEQARRDTMRNHTATHLLHAILRRELGDDVRQSGSLVHPPNLRFDFSFGRGLTPAEIQKVEDEVNAAILQNASVHARVMPLKDALASGALHLFDEKYLDEVRVIEAGPSRELCGGTHCHCTGDIGLFLITKEESIGAGLRRIEAVTGEGALREVRDMRERLGRAAAALRTAPARVPEAVAQLLEQRTRLEKDLATSQRSGLDTSAERLVAKAESLDGHRVIVENVGQADQGQLRALADRVRDLFRSGVVVLGSTSGDRAWLAVAVTKDLHGSIHAGEIVKRVAPIIGGGGYGPPQSATGGGKDVQRLTDALDAASTEVRRALGALHEGVGLAGGNV